MGNYLFILTTDELDKVRTPIIDNVSPSNSDRDNNDAGEWEEDMSESISSEADPSEEDWSRCETSTPQRMRRGPTQGTSNRDRDGDNDLLDERPDTDDEDFVYLRSFRAPYNRLEDTAADASSYTLSGSVLNELNPTRNTWKQLDMESLKFVDDFLAMEHIPLTSAYNIFSTERVRSVLHARGCQDFFTTVKKGATDIGMKVNDDKTQLLCINAVTARQVEVYFKLPNGQKIKGQTSLKQLGFTFGQKPNMDEHCAAMALKFRRRLWYLRHLKSAGIPGEDLLAIYKCFLLSILDYAAVVYGCMISKEQAHGLEMLQSSALKIIYGQSLSYARLIEESGIDTLQDRRQKLIDKFVLKAAENPKFKEEWFTQKKFTHHDLRNERIYEEKYARTERLYRSPIYTCRRRLNEIYLHQMNKERRND